MVDTPKKFLIISHKFPPYAGVGGYRWAQLCKYWARLGVEIHVVTVYWKNMREDSLLSAVQHPNIHIHRIPSGYPHNLAVKDFHNRIINGVRNKFFIHLVNKFYPQDIAQYWDFWLIPYCKKLVVKEKISVVIATGHPFMANVHAARLRRELDNIVLVQDMRDLWFSDALLNQANSKYYNVIKEYEEFALQNADAVVTVTEGCRKEFLKTAGSTPVFVIRNGYDHEKFQPLPAKSSKSEITHFVHLGSISSGREVCADVFFSYLRATDHCQASFAGSLPKDLLNKYSDLVDSGKLVFHGPVSQERCIELLAESDIALQFNAEHMVSAASTKIYEYAASRRPILSIGFGGEAADFIKRGKCGIDINLHSLEWKNDFDAIIKDIDSLSLSLSLSLSNADFISQFSYENLSKQYLSLISEIIEKAGNE